MSELPPAELSDAQHLAIDLLMAGKTDIEVAEQIGYTRQTVNGWRNHNPAFRHELETRRAHVRHESADLYVQARRKALEVVMAKLDEGDLQAAMFILKTAGHASLSAQPKPPALSQVRMSMAQDIEFEDLYAPNNPFSIELVDAGWAATTDPPLIETALTQ